MFELSPGGRRTEERFDGVRTQPGHPQNVWTEPACRQTRQVDGSQRRQQRAEASQAARQPPLGHGRCLRTQLGLTRPSFTWTDTVLTLSYLLYAFPSGWFCWNVAVRFTYDCYVHIVCDLVSSFTFPYKAPTFVFVTSLFCLQSAGCNMLMSSFRCMNLLEICWEHFKRKQLWRV